ncbi:MAG: sigma-70 family RNA polymerase sigma factor [Flavobacteriales bacterium]|nr:sigma-70 family RNA polymerase sigma factor [Flavobacteriales bacterium]
MAASKHPYEKEHDEQLMLLIGQRDQKAFEVLYDRYAKLMYNYFHRMLWKDREKARDFTQELFAKLVQKPHLYDISRPFKTWLYSIAHNMCKNEYAKQEVRKVAHAELKREDSFTALNESQRKMDRSSFMQKLKEALSELDEVKQQTFELRFTQELSIIEISEIMQVSEGTVKSRLFYILKELNQKLKVFEGITTWLIALGITIFN